MTEPPDQPPRPVLEYRRPPDRSERRSMPLWAQALVAFVIVGFSVVAVVLVVVLAFANASPTRTVAAGVIAWLATTAAWAAYALKLRRDAKYHGWVIGTWLALGAAGLLEGICFATFP